MDARLEQLLGRPVLRKQKLYGFWRRYFRRDPGHVNKWYVEAGTCRYKVIELTATGKQNKETCATFQHWKYCLEQYKGKNILPNMHAHDDVFIALEWLEGYTFIERKEALENATVSSLCDFYIRTFLHNSSSGPQKHRQMVLGYLSESLQYKIIKNDVYEMCQRSLERPGFLPYQTTTGLCLADTFMANFLVQPNKAFRFIDIDGIYTADKMEMICKFVLNLPSKFRSIALERLELTNANDVKYLPYYLMAALATRICAKSRHYRNSRCNPKYILLRKNVAKAVAQLETLVNGIHANQSIEHLIPKQ